MRKFLIGLLLPIFGLAINGHSENSFTRFETTNTCESQYPNKSRLTGKQYLIGYENCMRIHDLYSQAIIELDTSWNKMKENESITTLEDVYKSVSNLYNLLSGYQGILFTEKGTGIYGGDFGAQPIIQILADELLKTKSDIGLKLEALVYQEGLKKHQAINALTKLSIQNHISNEVKHNSGSTVSGLLSSSGSTSISINICPSGKIQNPKTRKCINPPKKKIPLKRAIQ